LIVPVLEFCLVATAHPIIEIAPSILACNLAFLGDEVRKAEAGGAAVIHVDVMDGHFVPNLTVGVPVVASLRKATLLPLDVHLMIESPEEFIAAFAEAGANRILVHQEATVHLDRALQLIREHGVETGAVINPATPVATLKEVLRDLDTVMVMSVNPGFGGQEFLAYSFEKIRELRDLRERHGYRYRIEVDGGVGTENIAALVAAGAGTFVAGTNIFHTADPAAAVRELLALARGALVQRAS
jgi:ribulose-phosphate 3-epimerase